MQTIVLYLCYIVWILLFSSAYNTSLIYCFVIWCLHTNERRPCSSTLSAHPSSSFPSSPRPATTFVAHYWKKLTCGVIRSFNFRIMQAHCNVWKVHYCDFLPSSENMLGRKKLEHFVWKTILLVSLSRKNQTAYKTLLENSCSRHWAIRGSNSL